MTENEVHAPTIKSVRAFHSPADLILTSVLAALGHAIAVGSRVLPSVRSQITRSLTVEVTAGRAVARHWIFDGPRRRATTRVGRAEFPDCSMQFPSSSHALRALSSPRAVERIIADYQRDRMRIDGSLVVVMWFYGLTRIFLRIGRGQRAGVVPHPYLGHDPSTTGDETIVIEPAATRLDPAWSAAWNARSRLWIIRAATDEPMPEP